MVGLALNDFGIMIILNTVILYIMDVYIKYAGSTITAVALNENMFAV